MPLRGPPKHVQFLEFEYLGKFEAVLNDFRLGNKRTRYVSLMKKQGKSFVTHSLFNVRKLINIYS